MLVTMKAALRIVRRIHQESATDLLPVSHLRRKTTATHEDWKTQKLEVRIFNKPFSAVPCIKFDVLVVYEAKSG